MGKKTININVKVDEEEKKILEEMAESRADGNISKSVRDAILFMRVFFDRDLTFDKLIRDEFKDHFLQSKDFRSNAPISSLIKNINNLAEDLNIVQ